VTAYVSCGGRSRLARGLLAKKSARPSACEYPPFVTAAAAEKPAGPVPGADRSTVARASGTRS
jgi:hypothetical protein